MKRYTDQLQKIIQAKESEFEIAIVANPSTGYTWKPDYDVVLVAQVGDIRTEQIAEGIGSTTFEIFTFQAFRIGQTLIKFNLSREWTPDKVLDSRSFELEIR